MIPFRPTVDRVFGVVWKLDDLRHQPGVYEVRLDRATFRDLYLYPPAGLSYGHAGWPAPGMRLFDMPVVCDPELARGEIRVRHEVDA